MQGNNQAIAEVQVGDVDNLQDVVDGTIYVNPEAVETLAPTFDVRETNITFRSGAAITVQGTPAAIAARLQNPEGEGPE